MKKFVKNSNLNKRLQGSVAINPESFCCSEESTCCSDESSSCSDERSCCETSHKKENWIICYIKTSAGLIPQISTRLETSDKFGTAKTRLGIGRMNYKVDPGIYAIGNPSSLSQVLVTANYKLTFDVVRKSMDGSDAWILVLDTKGVNVWCAAGKGTFGTKELINRISKTNLKNIVSHRNIILPQLGATGVVAHEITKKTGFKVTYGPVRIEDLKEFMANGNKASKEMRKVKFSFKDRIVLTPIEFVNALKTSVKVFAILFLLNLFMKKQFGLVDLYAYIGSLMVGCVVVPALLSWIPGRAFAWKGFLIGLIWALVVNLINGWPQSVSYGDIKAIGYFLVLPSVSAYYAMNFTGSSTYTSLSGVSKEMKIAVPAILGLFVIGTILLVLNGFAII